MKVSIVVPCRNERGHIDAFLQDLRDQQIPEGVELEVIVADGMSDDGTREALGIARRGWPRLRVVVNHRRIVSAGINAGIRAASGWAIVRMDVHTRYAPDYIEQSLAVLTETGADCVGGPWTPAGVNYTSNAVALVFDSWFVSGGGRAHSQGHEGPTDTVYLGCWKRQTFDRFGFFDESLVRSQDNELNFRIRKHGGIVWQSPRIRSWYRPRRSLAGLWRQYAQYGYWKAKVLQKHGRPATVRQLVPGAFVALLALLVIAAPISTLGFEALLTLLGGYGLASGTAAAIACRQPRDWRYLPVMPAIFAGFHFGFGYGFLRGIVDFLVLGRAGRVSFGVLTRGRAENPPPVAASR